MTRIYVGNLDYDTTESDLRGAFERFGRVSDVRLITDRVSGRPRGFAFVNMSRLEDADEAMTRLNGSSLRGRRLIVNEASSGQAPAPTAPRRSPAADLWQLL
jgi:RNA recognition motif-containing protein